jgi:hypothetical protein
MGIRTYINYKFTDEELENLKNGKCWCGKDKSEFQKGMRVFCSSEHREIWRKKVMTWQEFKDEFLRKHGEYCDICGARNDEKRKKQQYEEYKKEVEELKLKFQDGIIAEKLLKLEEFFEREYQKAIDPNNISDWDIEQYAKYHNIPLPEVDGGQITFEVDHKIAIVNGGDEFDINNLQVLCSDCHKKKTKNDLRIAMGKDPKSDDEKEVIINMDDTCRTIKLDEFNKDKQDGGE